MTFLLALGVYCVICFSLGFVLRLLAYRRTGR